MENKNKIDASSHASNISVSNVKGAVYTLKTDPAVGKGDHFIDDNSVVLFKQKATLNKNKMTALLGAEGAVAIDEAIPKAIGPYRSVGDILFDVSAGLFCLGGLNPLCITGGCGSQTSNAPENDGGPADGGFQSLIDGGQIADGGRSLDGGQHLDGGSYSWLQVSAGGDYTCGIMTNGLVKCWGENQEAANPPSGIFTQIRADTSHTCGIRIDGTIDCWGSDTNGESSPPSGTFTQISSCIDANCGVTTDNSVKCWGKLWEGSDTAINPPSETFKQVSLGLYYVCGIKTNDSVECWGAVMLPPVVPVPPSGAFKQISTGRRHTCGLKMDGSIECWGSNTYGESSPLSGTFTQISAGSQHTCGITTDGTIKCWGDDFYHQLDNIPSGIFMQISAGGHHSCAVSSNRTIKCWGVDAYGETTPPSP